MIELYAWGEVVNPKLYDVTNNKQMVINVTMQPHDKIVIDTTYGNKSITLIRNGEKSNILGYIRPDSKWFVLSAGDNVFTYDCDEGNMNLKVLFTVPVLYSGV